MQPCAPDWPPSGSSPPGAPVFRGREWSSQVKTLSDKCLDVNDQHEPNRAKIRVCTGILTKTEVFMTPSSRLSSRLASEFEAAVRARGHEYYRSKLVRVTTGNADRI